MDEDVLLRAVRAQPDEDGPRLAYADWLATQPDPHRRALAEFIRLQCGGGDPEAADALRKQHEEQWLGPLFPYVANTWRQFVRGFAFVAISAEEIAAAARFPLATCVLEVHVSGPLSGGGAAALAGWTHLEDLTGLWVQWSGMGPAWAERILAAPSLARAKLVSLHVYQGAIGDAGVRALARAPYAPRLESLRLGDNGITDDGLQALAAVPMTRLRTLELSANTFTLGGARILAGWEALSRLEVLWLRSCALDGQLLETLLASPHLRSLQVLGIPDNPIGAAGVAALAGWAGLAALEVLDLSGDALTDGGLAVLLGAGALRLRKLRLARSGLPARAAQALLTWPGLGALEELDVRENGWRDFDEPMWDAGYEIGCDPAHPEVAELRQRLGPRLRVGRYE